MERHAALTRRDLLEKSLRAAGLCAGALFVRPAFADPTQIASKIDEAPATHPLIPALKAAASSLSTLELIQDYTSTFAKTELVGRRTVKARMSLKLRHDPLSVYLRFIEPHAGREVLFVDGMHDNMLLAHETGLAGLVGTVTLDPRGSYAMDENRYPVTMLGMKTMVEVVIEQWLSETKMSGISVNFYPHARIGETACKAIETSHQDPGQGAKFQMTRLYIDAEHGWPIRVQQYGFASKRAKQPQLVEDYLYRDIRPNVGLSDVDFSPRNPDYAF